MFTNLTKNSVFFIGVAAGLALLALSRTETFKKGCAKLISAGMQLKEEAETFLETVKEDAQDMVAEAKAKKQVTE